MKEGWKMVKLGEVSSFQNGFAFKSSLFRDKGEPIIRISNIQDDKLTTNSLIYFNPNDYNIDFNQYIIYPNDILIAMSGGTTGKLGINQDNRIYYQNQRVGVIREKAEVLCRQYLYYFLKTKTEESLKIAAGAAQPNLSTAQINNFVIPLPPLEEQHRIVGILDAAFAKINALKTNAEANLKNAKALFQQVLAEELKPKEGWVEKKLGEIGDIQTGTTPDTKDKTNFGNFIPFIKPADVNYDGLGGLNYNNEGLSKSGVSNSRLIKRESVLMVCIGATISKTGYNICDVTCNQQINTLTPYDDDYKYCYYAMVAPKFKCEILKEGNSHQTTLPIINKKKWSNLTIFLPPLSEQHRIVATLDALSEKCRRLEQVAQRTISECDALKQSILRQAFSGEL